MGRCGQALSRPIRIDVSTIHQAKGAEADNVALTPDLTAATAGALASPRHAPAEHRAFYVGATRAKEKLLVLRPGANYAYPVSA
jgi:superfamily I DNA/RNA helicase